MCTKIYKKLCTITFYFYISYQTFNTTHFTEQFPNLTKIIQLSLIIPLSNGVVECVFSHQNLTKTDLRNRMNINTINMHLHISLNGPKNIDEFDFCKAYEHWSSKDRRII